MKLLEEKILERGEVINESVLKVDGFLNHQIDVALVAEMGKDIYQKFKDNGVNKILTIEASGIGLACLTAQFFNCNVLYAKKSKTSNIENSELFVSKAYSFTHKENNSVLVSKKYLSKDDNVLIIDDFLAHGEATNALIDLCHQAGANLVGVAVAIEKGFQKGGDNLRERKINLYSLAIIDDMKDGKIKFRR